MKICFKWEDWKKDKIKIVYKRIKDLRHTDYNPRSKSSI